MFDPNKITDDLPAILKQIADELDDGAVLTACSEAEIIREAAEEIEYWRTLNKSEKN